MTKAQWRVFLFILFLFTIAVRTIGLAQKDITINLKVGNPKYDYEQEKFNIDIID